LISASTSRPGLRSLTLRALALGLAAAATASFGGEIPGRIVFKNGLPEVSVQDEDAGIYFVKLVFCGDGPADPNTGKPDFLKLTELRTVTYGRAIEGKKLPGRKIDISKKDLIARKEEDPNTLILLDKNRKRVIYEGPIPGEAVWMKIRYDTAIHTRTEGAHFPGARNWIALPLPELAEDRWVRLDPVPDPCPTRVIEVTAKVKGTFPDERDFTSGVVVGCE
jgi:hypothetical protein